MNEWMHIWLSVCYCRWEIILRFFSVSCALLLLLLLFLYKSNVNRVHKEKLLPPIAVMYIDVMVDTPRYCDYVYFVWVVVLSFSLSLLSFLLRIYCSGCVSSAQYGDDAQDLFFTAADTIHSSLFLSVSLLFLRSTSHHHLYSIAP
jgi:hypothetical protein